METRQGRIPELEDKTKERLSLHNRDRMDWEWGDKKRKKNRASGPYGPVTEESTFLLLESCGGEERRKGVGLKKSSK